MTFRFIYQVEATVEEVATGCLDRHAAEYLDRANVPLDEQAGLRELLCGINRAVGEVAALIPRGMEVLVRYEGHTAEEHGPGEDVAFRLSVFERIDPERTEAMSNGHPLTGRGAASPGKSPDAVFPVGVPTPPSVPVDKRQTKRVEDDVDPVRPEVVDIDS